MAKEKETRFGASLFFVVGEGRTTRITRTSRITRTIKTSRKTRTRGGCYVVVVLLRVVDVLVVVDVLDSPRATLKKAKRG